MDGFVKTAEKKICAGRKGGGRERRKFPKYLKKLGKRLDKRAKNRLQ